MKDITQRLLSSAEWVDRNSVYHFKEDQNHNARRLSSDAVENMLEAAETIRNLRQQVETWYEAAMANYSIDFVYKMTDKNLICETLAELEWCNPHSIEGGAKHLSISRKIQNVMGINENDMSSARIDILSKLSEVDSNSSSENSEYSTLVNWVHEDYDNLHETFHDLGSFSKHFAFNVIVKRRQDGPIKLLPRKSNDRV